ncbi:CsbD family protein [Cellvibrio sp. PSBB006]|uniref:CsbD family protein n=1 Tax=Cellvibrio sp. PSBB006 TaxID=1987723 RepID=UPI000B3BA8D2|nr:CsbD family protein [Cellvibrio sp. PSBB006]ARU26992.1 general stress protein CsbD [Cellvibrio sp. PSBB006]
MNNDILEGKWKQLKGSVQAKWGEITDDEFDQVKGNRERLIGLVQEKYGKKKDDVRKEVDDYFKSVN